MPTFKVKSAIKRNGELYAPGSEIELSAKEAKELGDSLEIDRKANPELAPRAPKTEAEKKAAKAAKEAAKKAADAKEKANDEVTAALNEAGAPDDVDPDLDEPTVTNVSRETTQEDLDNDPALVEQGVKVGDVREYPGTTEESATGDDL